MTETQERGASMPDQPSTLDTQDADFELQEDAEQDEQEFESPLTEVIPPARPASNLDTEERMRLIVGAADAVRAEDIEVLDLRELTIIADFFMICTGKSSIQLRAIADRIDERMREEGIRKPRIEGYQEATWILLDYGDVVCHLMAAEQRAFYRLEEFWAAAPRMELELLPEEARNVRGVPTRFETLTEEVDGR